MEAVGTAEVAMVGGEDDDGVIPEAGVLLETGWEAGLAGWDNAPKGVLIVIDLRGSRGRRLAARQECTSGGCGSKRANKFPPVDPRAIPFLCLFVHVQHPPREIRPLRCKYSTGGWECQAENSAARDG